MLLFYLHPRKLMFSTLKDGGHESQGACRQDGIDWRQTASREVTLILTLDWCAQLAVGQ
jgi:hypothetical protein